jgi:hypothetical protein
LKKDREDLPLGENLRRCGITRISKEGEHVLLMMDEKVVLFHISKDGIYGTFENFRKNSKGIMDVMTQQAIIILLSREEYAYFFSFDSSKKKDATPSEQNDNFIIVKEDIQNEKNICQELGKEIPDGDYVEYVIKIAKRTVKGEDALVRLLVYVGLTVYSHNPLCLGIRAPTSEGKTYSITQTIQKFFPKEDIWLIGSMSPKALIRQNGVLVDSNGEPLEARIRELKVKIKECDRDDDLNQKIYLESKLSKLYQTGKWLIDLHGKTLVFLEPPHPDLWEIIKSILSHDSWEIEHPYVDADLKTKNIVTRGWPVCIFCSAKDESKWDIWPEVQSRFMIVSPNMSKAKYLESNRLTFQKLGLPDFVQQQIIVSDTEVDLARKCILYLKQRISRLCPIRYVQNEYKPYNPVSIPYHEYLAESLPHHKGSAMRTASQVGSLLDIVTLTRSQFMFDFKTEKMVIARPEDLVEVLRITKNMTDSNYSNLPTHKVKFLKEIFRPVYESKSSPDSKDDKTEKIIAVTSKELCDFYKKQKGRGITTDNLKKQYLNELLVNDVIGEARSEIDGRQYNYYPLIDLRDENEASECLAASSESAKITKLSNTDSFDNLLYIPRIKLSKNYKEILEDWLIIHILALANYRIGLDKTKGCLADFLNTTDEFKLFEIKGNDESRLTIREFISKYESNPSISIRYIFKSQFYEFDSKLFGRMIGICLIERKDYKKLSNKSSFDNFDIYSKIKALPLLIPIPLSLPLIQSASKNVKNEELKSIDDQITRTETNGVPCTEDYTEVDLPILNCSVCHEYRTAIEFDMALHIIEFHSKQLTNHIYKAEGIELHAEFNDMVDYAIDMAKGIVQCRTYSECIFCEVHLLRNGSVVREHLVQFHKLDLEESLQQIRSDYPDKQDMNIEKMLQIVIDTVVYELPAQYLSY